MIFNEPVIIIKSHSKRSFAKDDQQSDRFMHSPLKAIFVAISFSREHPKDDNDRGETPGNSRCLISGIAFA